MDDHWDEIHPLIQQYAGEIVTGAEDAKFRENHYFEWLSTNLPLYYMRAPRLRATSHLDSIEAESATIAIESEINRTLLKYGFDEEALMVAYDFAFAYGIFCVTGQDYGYDPQIGMKTWRPRPQRIAPERFIYDPLCTSTWDHASWLGHMIVLSPEAFEAMAENGEGWDLAAIRAAGDDARNDLPGRNWIADEQEAPDRQEIVAYSIWLRDVQPDESKGPEDGYHGAVCVVADSDNEGYERFLRKPVPFKGPACGPYAWVGCYTVSNSPVPMGPLQAQSLNVRELNTATDVIMRGMENYKRGVAVDQANDDLIDAIQNQPDTRVWPVQGLNANQNTLKSIEIGGVTEQMMTAYTILRERLDRNSGMHEAQRGKITGGTASEVSIAQANADVRISFIKERFTRGIRRVLEIMAEYYLIDSGIAFRVNPDQRQPIIDPETGMPMPTPVFIGGVTGDDADGDGLGIDDLDLQIEPYSMEHTNQSLMQERWIQMVELLLKVGPAMQAMPWIDWTRVLEKGGDVLNDPEFGSLVNTAMLSLVQGVGPQIGGQVMQGPPNQLALTGQTQPPQFGAGRMQGPQQQSDGYRQNGKVAV